MMTVRLGLALVLVLGVVAPLRAEDAAGKFDPQVARRIKPEEVQKRIAAGEKPIVLDTRGHLGDVIAKDAVVVPNDRVETWAKDKPRDALIVTYCT